MTPAQTLAESHLSDIIGPIVSSVTKIPILPITMTQRIQKILAAAGIASRRIYRANDPGWPNYREWQGYPHPASHGRSHLRQDYRYGERIRLREAPEQRIYLLMNKPKGVLLAPTSAGGSSTR